METNFVAVVFDCDGVLLDTETHWTAAEEELFARYDKSFNPDAKREMLGTSFETSAMILERILEQPGRAAELSTELVEIVTESMSAEAKPLPGVAELIEELVGHLPIAVASNSHRALLTAALDAAGLLGMFDAVVAGDDVAEPKPAPDIYLRACDLLEVEPSETIAFEDSPTGVAAARAAGLHVVGIPSFPGVDLDAHSLAASLGDAAVKALLGLP
ncbi:MAG: HAD-IA family hydrolase [Actinobacteria bacterium]|nr:HAD-IA family hydrolase [Actinomycetota bacterium]